MDRTTSVALSLAKRHASSLTALLARLEDRIQQVEQAIGNAEAAVHEAEREQQRASQVHLALELLNQSGLVGSAVIADVDIAAHHEEASKELLDSARSRLDEVLEERGTLAQIHEQVKALLQEIADTQ